MASAAIPAAPAVAAPAAPAPAAAGKRKRDVEVTVLSWNACHLLPATGEYKKKLADTLSYGTDSSRFLGSGIEYVQSRPYQYGDPVRSIRVEGSQRIEPETVRSYLTFKQGETATPEALDKSLKALFATGLFADVILRREGEDIVVRVIENPIINRIAFEGNLRVEDEVLSQEIRLRPRVVASN